VRIVRAAVDIGNAVAHPRDLEQGPDSCHSPCMSAEQPDQPQINAAAQQLILQARIHLSALEAQRASVIDRIRKLRQVTNGLALLQSRSPKSHRCGKEQLPVSATSPIDETEIGPTEKLRRACRIALMEADQPQGAREVLLRVMKRGSYSFSGQAGAIEAIARELNQMVSNGEARRHEIGQSPRWEWNAVASSAPELVYTGGPNR
jgi:hypothetical protein